MSLVLHALRLSLPVRGDEMKGPWRLRSVPLVSVSLFPAPSRFCGCVHMHQVCPPSPLQCKSREVAQEAIERGGAAALARSFQIRPRRPLR